MSGLTTDPVGIGYGAKPDRLSTISTETMNRLFLPLLAAVALVAAGCGGASDSTTDTGGSSSKATKRLSLVAYSTPQVVYDGVIPAFE